ncbi:hypothetical protein [Aquitalea sp. ASV11]|nr:hypothetical protein [Aquitalea sp. ASV11]
MPRLLPGNLTRSALLEVGVIAVLLLRLVMWMVNRLCGGHQAGSVWR